MKKNNNCKIIIGITILLFLLLLLVSSNYIWYRKYKREQEKLKNAIIPTLTNDYFLNQVALTQNKKNTIIELENSEKIKKDIENNQTKWMVDAPLINQNPMYPNGCEAASAVMLLNYYGIEITLEEFVNHYLTKEIVYEIEGKRYGPDPALYYAGDPTSEKRGWGCFEPVIASSIQKVIEEEKYKKNTFETYLIRSEGKEPLSFYATFSSPFLIWITTNYEEASDIYEWFSYDSKYTYTYPKNSHVVLITGVDELYYYINDPLKEEKNIKIEKETLEKSFDSMGRQMIFLSRYILESE